LISLIAGYNIILNADEQTIRDPHPFPQTRAILVV
jgi:hypothetical protein